jgi:phage tail-like protein
VLSPRTWQVLSVVRDVPVLDVATDRGRGDVLLLTADGVRRYDQHGRRLAPLPGVHARADALSVTVGRSAEPTRERYAYVVHQGATGLLRVPLQQTGGAERVGDLDAIQPGWRPDLLEALPNGTLLAGTRGSDTLRQLDGDGRLLRTLRPRWLIGRELVGLAAAGAHDALVATTTHIARVGIDVTTAGDVGSYYSPVLDRGTRYAERWDRAHVDVSLPAGTAMTILAHAGDDARAVARSRRDARAADQGASAGDGGDGRDGASLSVAPGDWPGGATFLARTAPGAASPSDPYTPDRTSDVPGVVRLGPICVSGSAEAGSDPRTTVTLPLRTGLRYVWLELRLHSFEDGARPTATQLDVLYPLRPTIDHLPAIYQEDPPAADLLDRFMTAPEILFDDLDRLIDGLAERLDPRTAPPDFLPWLGSWLDIAMRPSWTTDARRRLLARANHLYAVKGTPCGLVDLMEIVTGQTPQIVEARTGCDDLVLGSPRAPLGSTSVLLSSPLPAVAAGDTVTADAPSTGAAAAAEAGVSELPSDQVFGPWILVRVDGSKLGATSAHDLQALLDLFVPAHVCARLVMDTEAGLDQSGAALDQVSLRDDRWPSLDGGLEIGRGILGAGEPDWSELERNAALRDDYRLY